MLNILDVREWINLSKVREGERTQRHRERDRMKERKYFLKRGTIENRTWVER